jgi:MYXO-CTERM domain-containing protein
MRRTTTTRLALALSLLPAVYCAAAPPAQLAPPTIIDSAPAFPGYGVDNVLDGNVLTDYASQGRGVNTFIDFDFGSPTAIGQVVVTDRTTSGGGNGTFVGGQFDKVTAFDLIFSNQADFSSPITTLHVPSPYANRPPSTNGPEDFQTTVPVPGVTAQYVRFDVTAAAGANPGAAEFQFFDVPEPSAGLTLLLACALTSRRARRRS